MPRELTVDDLLILIEARLDTLKERAHRQIALNTEARAPLNVALDALETALTKT